MCTHTTVFDSCSTCSHLSTNILNSVPGFAFAGTLTLCLLPLLPSAIVTVIPALTLAGILNLNSFLPGGATLLGLLLLLPLLEPPPLLLLLLPPGPSSANTATAFITSHPTASKTCRARLALKPISTHVLTAASWFDPPPLLLLALVLLRLPPLFLLLAVLLVLPPNDPLKELECGLEAGMVDVPRLG